MLVIISDMRVGGALPWAWNSILSFWTNTWGMIKDFASDHFWEQVKKSGLSNLLRGYSCPCFSRGRITWWKEEVGSQPFWASMLLCPSLLHTRCGRSWRHKDKLGLGSSVGDNCKDNHTVEWLSNIMKVFFLLNALWKTVSTEFKT